MKSKRNKIMLALAIVCVFAISFSAFNLIFANKRTAHAEDTDAFVKTSVQAENAVVLTPTADDGVTASGNQTNDRTVVVFDRAYTLGSKINFTITINADVTDTGSNDALKGYVYSALYFAQATKTEDGFSASDFYFNRSSGNGMRLHLFTNSGDLKPQNRAMINIGTFTKKDIVNGDSVWGGLGDGGNDLGWAFVNGKPIDVEIGSEKVGGVDKIYIQFTINRPGRPNLTVYKVSINQSDLIDTENEDGYYIAFEAANLDATERAVSAEISKISATEAALLVTPEAVFLKPTQTENLVVKNKITQEVITEGLTFVSDNPAVATVDGDGKITAVKAGTATIEISQTDGGTGVAYVTVADNITLNQSQVSLFTGQTSTLVATTNPANLNVIWESDNEAVATVSNGLVTAVTVGTANIKATVQNFESGALEISTTAAITVSEYVKPDDIHNEDFDIVYSDGIIISGTGGAYSEGIYTYNATAQSGYSYLVLEDGLLFDNPVSFDFINDYDESNTNDGNHMNRFFGISIVQGDRELLEASDYALGSAHGLQINFSANDSWYSWGGKFILNYRTSVSGTVKSGRTPENTGNLTGTDRFANAFCRAFNDGIRIQVKIWKADDKLNVSFTPVFIEGEVPTGEYNDPYPNGGQYDYIGPYTMTFNYDEVATGEGRFAIAIGTGNTITGTVANMNYSISNLDIGTLYGVSLDKEALNLKKGSEASLKVTYNPSTYVPMDAAWTSSDTSVATVSETGVITAVSGGRAVITYTVDGLSATCAVTVIESLSVNTNEVSIKVGETFKIEATTNPEGVDIMYASGDPRIAEVAADGTITAVAKGTVKIYVRTGGELFTEEITVTVSKAKPTITDGDGTNGGSSCAGCSGSVSTGITGFTLSVITVIGVLLIIGLKRKFKKQ